MCLLAPELKGTQHHLNQRVINWNVLESEDTARELKGAQHHLNPGVVSPLAPDSMGT